jgi:hypothetical protein
MRDDLASNLCREAFRIWGSAGGNSSVAYSTQPYFPSSLCVLSVRYCSLPIKMTLSSSTLKAPGRKLSKIYDSLEHSEVWEKWTGYRKKLIF